MSVQHVNEGTRRRPSTLLVRPSAVGGVARIPGAVGREFRKDFTLVLALVVQPEHLSTH